VATSPDLPPPDPLDLLASEVGADLEEELEREGLLSRVRSGAGAVLEVPARTRKKIADLVDGALDKVFAAPLDVPTAQDAIDQLDELGDDPTGAETSRRIAGTLAAAGPVLARLARGGGALAKVAGAGAKVIPSGRAVTLGATAFLATVRVGASARIGVKELQVLASYLVERHRAEGLDVHRGLVEQATVRAYLDPNAAIRPRPGDRPSYAALARIWTARSFRGPGATKRATLNRKRVDALARLELAPLVAAWEQASGGDASATMKAIDAPG
jgi:hypothetical protein